MHRMHRIRQSAENRIARREKRRNRQQRRALSSAAGECVNPPTHILQPGRTYFLTRLCVAIVLDLASLSFFRFAICVCMSISCKKRILQFQQRPANKVYMHDRGGGGVYRPGSVHTTTNCSISIVDKSSAAAQQHWVVLFLDI